MLNPHETALHDRRNDRAQRGRLDVQCPVAGEIGPCHGYRRYKYTKERTIAPTTGAKNTAHNIHRFNVLGSMINSVALATAAIESAQPMNAFA